MSIPTIPFLLRVAADFQLPARYTLAMLGMVAGFRPRFVGEDEAPSAVCYGYDAPGSDAPAATLPASRDAHAFLRTKQRLAAGDMIIARWEKQPLPVLFPSKDTLEPDIAPGLPAFDVVSNAFFFLSLHEEWSSDGADDFGRFRAADSLLGRAGLLDLPVVARYASLLVELLRRRGIALPPRGAGPPVVCLTHDVDYITKRTPGLLRREAVHHLLLNRLHRPLGMRLRRFREYLSFARPGKDPYRVSFERMLAAERAAGFHATWFLKAGRTDRRDAPVYLGNSWLRSMLGKLEAAGHERGLHPSFNVFADAEALRGENAALESVTGSAPRSLRQHYLRFRYPDTWRAQAGCGFTADSTLGFAEREGFRNGCCHPFLPFDLERGEALPIWELPLAVMDGTLQDYRGMEAEEGEQRIRELFDATRAETGVFVVLFHNVCWDSHDFPGWDGVFLRFLAKLESSGARCLTIAEAADWWLERAGYRDLQDLLRTVDGRTVDGRTVDGRTVDDTAVDGMEPDKYLARDA